MSEEKKNTMDMALAIEIVAKAADQGDIEVRFVAGGPVEVVRVDDPDGKPISSDSTESLIAVLDAYATLAKYKD